MTKRKKYILFISALALAGTITYLVIKKRNKSTIEQFETFRQISLQNGWNIFKNAKEDFINISRELWLKNLNKSEAETLVLLSQSAYPTGINKINADAIIAKWGINNITK